MEIEDYIQKANFDFFIPSVCKPYNISFRGEGEKWSTLWFKCDYEGGTYRFKEFFMDWFYQGFPKSMMSSFVETYSSIQSGKIGKIVFHKGKDYKGLDSISAFCDGTQIEIEYTGPGTIKEDIIRDIIQIKNPLMEGKAFHERSFHARTGKWDWFEERRIAISKWRGEKIEDDNCPIVSYGMLEDILHIFVFTDNKFSKVFWMDIADVGHQNEHLFYKFRKNLGIYNIIFQMKKGVIGLRGPYGPVLLQINGRDKILTFTSNLYLDLESFIKEFNNRLVFASEITDKDLLEFKI